MKKVVRARYWMIFTHIQSIYFVTLTWYCQLLYFHPYWAWYSILFEKLSNKKSDLWKSKSKYIFYKNGCSFLFLRYLTIDNQLHMGHICSAKPHVAVDPLQPTYIRIFPGILLTNMYYFSKSNVYGFQQNSLRKLIIVSDNNGNSVKQIIICFIRMIKYLYFLNWQWVMYYY